jgi:hypothetical protein
MTFKIQLESAFINNFNFAVCFGSSEYHLFSISAVFEVLRAGAKQSLCASLIILNSDLYNRSLLK